MNIRNSFHDENTFQKFCHGANKGDKLHEFKIKIKK